MRGHELGLCSEVVWASLVAVHTRMGKGDAALCAALLGMARAWLEGARGLSDAQMLALMVVGSMARGCARALEALAAAVDPVGRLGWAE